MTGVHSDDRDSGIEWRTYTPDGRVLVIRRTDEGWAAACDGRGPYVSDSLHAAIRDAVGHERGEALTLHPESHASLSEWVAEQAARIEREAQAS